MKYILTSAAIAICLIKGHDFFLTQPQNQKVYDEIAKAINQNAAYTQLLVKKTFEKDIERCKKDNLGLDLKTLECVKEPTK